MSAPKDYGACLTCGLILSRQNRSGYCKHHVSAAKAKDPAWRAAQKAGAKRALQVNPERMDALRARCRAHNTSAEHRAWAKDRAHQIGLAAIGSALSHTAEANAKRGASRSATAMSWCPPHLREQYRALVYSKRIPAPEAKALILEQEAKELAALRRRMEQYA